MKRDYSMIPSGEDETVFIAFVCNAMKLFVKKERAFITVYKEQAVWADKSEVMKSLNNRQIMLIANVINSW